jgi:hypothetical protein
MRIEGYHRDRIVIRRDHSAGITLVRTLVLYTCNTSVISQVSLPDMDAGQAIHSDIHVEPAPFVTHYRMGPAPPGTL